MKKKHMLLNQLYDVRNNDFWSWNYREKKYIELVINTLNKYEDHGKLLACIIYRTFCNDIAWQILDYI